jgi:hypothetical protein
MLFQISGKHRSKEWVQSQTIEKSGKNEIPVASEVAGQIGIEKKTYMLTFEPEKKNTSRCSLKTSFENKSGAMFDFERQGYFGGIGNLVQEFEHIGRVNKGDRIFFGETEYQVADISYFPKRIILADGHYAYILEDGVRIRQVSYDPQIMPAVDTTLEIVADIYEEGQNLKIVLIPTKESGFNKELAEGNSVFIKFTNTVVMFTVNQEMLEGVSIKNGSGRKTVDGTELEGTSQEISVDKGDFYISNEVHDWLKGLETKLSDYAKITIFNEKSIGETKDGKKELLPIAMAKANLVVYKDGIAVLRTNVLLSTPFDDANILGSVLYEGYQEPLFKKIDMAHKSDTFGWAQIGYAWEDLRLNGENYFLGDRNLEKAKEDAKTVKMDIGFVNAGPKSHYTGFDSEIARNPLIFTPYGTRISINNEQKLAKVRFHDHEKEEFLWNVSYIPKSFDAWKWNIIEKIGRAESDQFNMIKMVYPNPARGHVTVEVEIPGHLEDPQTGPKPLYIEIGIYDVAGTRLKSAISEPIGPGKYKITFDTRDLPNGSYAAMLEGISFADGWHRIGYGPGTLFIISR